MMLTFCELIPFLTLAYSPVKMHTTYRFITLALLNCASSYNIQSFDIGACIIITNMYALRHCYRGFYYIRCNNYNSTLTISYNGMHLNALQSEYKGVLGDIQQVVEGRRFELVVRISVTNPRTLEPYAAFFRMGKNPQSINFLEAGLKRRYPVPCVQCP